MTAANDFLVEIGTEELPPKALRSLMQAFADNLRAAIDEARLAHDEIHAYASPRRLSLLVEQLAEGQEDRRVTRRGPPVHVAFDDDGKPKPAATAFAGKCGVDVDDLDREKTDKGEWLVYEALETGRSAKQLLPQLIENALAGLPIPRRMRWGSSDAEFVRPVHWVVLLHGKQVIDATIMGVRSGNLSHGHRFHSSKPVKIDSPEKYLDALEKKGFVIADFERRRDMVREGVEAEAESAGGHIVEGENLYDEVTALVEWPVPMTGRFDEAFLELPREVVVSTLTGHQRYFPVADPSGKLLPRFVTVANLESSDPDQVRDGNERVIRPRLADAAFFWQTDRRTTLAHREEALRDVVYQRGLGSLHDKSARVTRLAAAIAGSLHDDQETVTRAASLAKCDLLTGMVGEFPELQGTMGRYYALSDGEPTAVAEAIGEHYAPRFAGDELPASAAGRVLAIADRLDTLAGVFSLGKKPSGNRDPFGLRRAALGVVRILVECSIDLELPALIDDAVQLQPKGKLAAEGLREELLAFFTERLRRYFLDREAGLDTETFEAVRARAPASLVDFELRLQAVQAFLGLDEAQSLAAANKRIANILKQAGLEQAGSVNPKRFKDDAETALYDALSAARENVAPMIAARRYTEALSRLAALREPVDRFFDDVMVMADDSALKENRLALLSELRALFLDIADISRLSFA